MIVKIAGKEFSDFTDVEVNFNYDSVSDTFALTLPYWEHWQKDIKLFKPLAYQIVEIWNDKRRKLLTGYLLSHSFKSNSNANEMSLSGYSKTGILDDCDNIANSITMPDSGNQSTCYNNMTLKQLAETFVQPFGIELEIDDIVKTKVETEPYEQTTSNSDNASIASFLSKMCTLKNVILRTTSDGKLKFTQIDANAAPVTHFSTGDGIVNEITVQFNGQGLHSELHLSSAVNLDSTNTGVANIIKNPLISLFRPKMHSQGVENSMIKDVCKAALAEELKSNITVNIECKGWKIIDDDILKPGDIITVYAPDVYLYKKTKLLVRSIKLKESAKEKSSSIECILPEAMSGEQPQIML